MVATRVRTVAGVGHRALDLVRRSLDGDLGLWARVDGVGALGNERRGGIERSRRRGGGRLALEARFGLVAVAV